MGSKNGHFAWEVLRKWPCTGIWKKNSFALFRFKAHFGPRWQDDAQDSQDEAQDNQDEAQDGQDEAQDGQDAAQDGQEEALDSQDKAPDGQDEAQDRPT